MFTTGLVYPVLLSNISRMRVFFNILGRHTLIEHLDFGYYPGNRLYSTAALEPFLSFFFKSPELFTSLVELDFGADEWDNVYFNDSDVSDEEEGLLEPLMTELLRGAIKDLKQAIKDKKPCCAAKIIYFRECKFFSLE